MKIIDATNVIVGRLATKVAKAALEGEQIHVINAEKAVFSGSEKDVLAKFQQRRERTVPLKGPYYPKQSHLIVKRVIRGMIPYKTPKGRAAMANIKCHVGVPAELEGKKAEHDTQNTHSKLPYSQYVTVQRVSQYIGGKQ